MVEKHLGFTTFLVARGVLSLNESISTCLVPEVEGPIRTHALAWQSLSSVRLPFLFGSFLHTPPMFLSRMDGVVHRQFFVGEYAKPC